MTDITMDNINFEVVTKLYRCVVEIMIEAGLEN